MAEETGAKWWAAVLIIPIVVGVVLAIVTYVLPKLFEPKNELSYTIETPQSIEGLKLNIENAPVAALYVYKVRVWNSGGNALKSLPVLFRFDSSPSDFKILNVSHTTKPAYQFGDIQEEQTDQISRKYTYSLLNKDDEDKLTFLTNRTGNVSIFAKSESLSVKPVAANADTQGMWKGLSIWTVVGGILVSLLTMLLSKGFISKRLPSN
jgi:heme/copper-type cytochrome/quinol oxidase subunit 2